MNLDFSNPRSAKALLIAADAGQWWKCRGADGSKAYGIRSGRDANHVYLVSQAGCTCPDAARHAGQPCKHQLAVRLHCALARAEQRQLRRAHLRLV